MLVKLILRCSNVIFVTLRSVRFKRVGRYLSIFLFDNDHQYRPVYANEKLLRPYKILTEK